MASTISICNQALSKVGADRIVSLQDETAQAKLLNAIFDVKRDAELAARPWTFAIKREMIPASSTPPAFEWRYAYPLPSDYLALVQVGDSFTFYDNSSGEFGGQKTFEPEGGAILTNEASPLKIRYIQRITNSGLFPPLFVEALACRLAAEICEKLTQNLSKRDAAWKERQQALREAIRVNAIERPPEFNPPTSWVRALEGG